MEPSSPKSAAAAKAAPAAGAPTETPAGAKPDAETKAKAALDEKRLDEKKLDKKKLDKKKPPQGLRTMVLRVVLALCGLVMFMGFFLPWMQLGKLMDASGFQLILGSGEMVDQFFGPQRWVLLAVPVLGTLLVVVAVIGHRIIAWIAVLAGLTVLGFGLLRLLTFFFETTGMGVWLIVSAAFIALAAGLLEIGAARRR